ncbi:MAG: DUF2817 domain-containing protein [Leptospiraceae bacterium]|nr:DUF2817 domain-containing protein [Leptospiraceae bacterium]
MQLPHSNQTISIASTAQGLPIELTCIGTGELPVLLIGGVHGNESEGFLFAERLQKELLTDETALHPGLRLYICPRLNPDGCQRLRRTNQNNVDLNRNLPTKDWQSDFENVKYYPGPSAGSELESRITLDMVQAIQPACIISLHSYENAMINYNGPCLALAERMSSFCGLPPKGDIGYPTPGSLGTWAGWERQIPTITLEVLRGQEPDAVWSQHRTGVLKAIEFYLDHPRPASSYH